MLDIAELVLFFEGYGYHGNSFEQTYRCYPASFIDKPQLETGDKIIMPPSALDRLASLHIDYPMLFELRNAATQRVSHCGVLEFIAEEGMIYMPYWMMQNLLLQEGDIVLVKNATLPKGTYVKLQPHTKDFLDISNPKAILETTLRNYSCLTTGDSIMVPYNNKKYYIDIVETKPSSAISIIETDCEVDFAPPLDYKEPERPQSSVPSRVAPAKAQDAEAVTEEEPKFTPFTGAGRRLDGKPSKHQTSPVLPLVISNPEEELMVESPLHHPLQKTALHVKRRESLSLAQMQFVLQRSSKGVLQQLEFEWISKAQAPAKETKEEPPKKEEPKFQAFTGKKYSLKG
uniref:Ubiquitin fusion degradation protein 1 homolog n=1 Tax=Ananas comosus var. bracteatus TaxID=296719 RepID=A0A6V7NTJ7_ANACO|nr:unnamed protein product [Ananas comosus var. bracteatus]